MKRKHQFVWENSWYSCSVCHWKWKTRTYAACPGVPRYRYDALPPYLVPAPELHRRGLHAQGSADGCYCRLKEEEPVWLFDERKAVPLDPLWDTPLRPLAQLSTWFRECKNCRWCGGELTSEQDEYGRHPRICRACFFEQQWLQQRNDIGRWAHRLFQQKNWLILDTETMGLRETAEPLELALLAYDGAVLLNTLLRPQATFSDEGIFVNGLRKSDVASAPSFVTIWPALLTFLEQYPMVISYNAEYHQRILEHAAHRANLALPPLRWYCLMKIYATYWGHLRRDGRFRWQQLNEACKQQRVPGGWSQTHRALKDARKSFRLLDAMASNALPLSPKNSYTLFGVR